MKHGEEAAAVREAQMMCVLVHAGLHSDMLLSELHCRIPRDVLEGPQDFLLQ